MKSLILYELFKRKKELFISLLISFLPLGMGILLKSLFPAVIDAAMHSINRQRWLLGLLGLENGIKTIAYRHLVMNGVMVSAVVLFFRSIYITARTNMQERNSGRYVFFLTQPVSRFKIWLVRYAFSTLEYVLCTLLMYVPVYIICVSGIKNEFTKKYLFSYINSYFLVLVLMLMAAASIGTLLGMGLRNWGSMRNFIRIYAACISFDILPDVINSLVFVLSEYADVRAVEKAVSFFDSVRSILPTYWVRIWTYDSGNLPVYKVIVLVICLVMCTFASYMVAEKGDVYY